ncbi:MAG TPA: type II toxin-antitoxin system prevent-host-death family antitoxin [Acidimicrobiales bacterium]|nr:type II toxin-antitoxin system prevent-host-death family antitoxin [Acidimicrobiales bacterium]
MTKFVGVHEAKTHLSGLLEDVASGEEVVITRRGEAVARLVGVRDDFDAPLDSDVLEVFES